jgi:hypothetical protein
MPMEHPKLRELKENNENWEHWFECSISQRHFCNEVNAQKELSGHNAAIILASCEGSPYVWLYGSVWLAEEKEIYDGEAEVVGEVMSSYLFSICYCPFCGEKLDGAG